MLYTWTLNVCRRTHACTHARTHSLYLCLQDFYKFCVFAFLLQVCIFMLSVSRLSQHAHSGDDTFKRTMSVLIAAIPTGAPTGKCLVASLYTITCRVFLQYAFCLRTLLLHRFCHYGKCGGNKYLHSDTFLAMVACTSNQQLTSQSNVYSRHVHDVVCVVNHVHVHGCRTQTGYLLQVCIVAHNPVPCSKLLEPASLASKLTTLLYWLCIITRFSGFTTKHVMPAVLVCAIGAGIERLRHKQIDVLLPDKIKTVACVDTVCFDKTGTLTGSNVSIHICHHTLYSSCVLSVLDCSIIPPVLIARSEDMHSRRWPVSCASSLQPPALLHSMLA